jgi:hypothetical protein
MFGLNSEERERRRRVRRDREYLEPRSRRFLKIYLDADEGRKPDFYRVINDAVATCYPDRPPPGLQDAEIADGAALAALKVVLARIEQMEDDPTSDFLTDAYATVGIAYHRAAGVYVMDQDLQKLGTAAVHLLTIATSYMSAENTELLSHD